ncbi:Protein of unknown function DUF761, plant [Dillenia turbinata]|uniref:Uncharacterized protein n=1 Tax=Dillenia turbinata TaxID=194707 RepID=A0AAN8ZEH6_9MAGN
MSCLNFGKGFPPAKAWKSFTTKIQTKLHRLNKSKAITKPRTTKAALHAPVAHKPRPRRKRWLFQPSQTIHFRFQPRHRLQRRAAAVYVDELFIGQAIKKHIKSSAKTSKKLTEEDTPPVNNIKIKLLDEPSSPNKSKASTSGSETSNLAADDMWESLGLASPQMHGIDARAEEFIAKFRAEMELQEILAHGLIFGNVRYLCEEDQELGMWRKQVQDQAKNLRNQQNGINSLLPISKDAEV